MKCAVKKCCYCIPLKAGTIVVAALYGVFSTLSAGYLIRRTIVDDIAPENKDFVLAQSCVQGSLVGLFIVLCAALIYGAAKEKLMVLKVWVSFSVSSLVIWTIIYIVLSAVYFATAPLLYAIVYSVIAVVGTAINAYGVLIVYSFYNHLYKARKAARAQIDELEPMSHRRPVPIAILARDYDDGEITSDS